MSTVRKIRVVLLPGLDGTARLLEEFVRKCPPQFEALPIAYPPDRLLAYEELAGFVLERIRGDIPTILLGESFGGPLALKVASKLRGNLAAVVLVATFVQPPFLRVARFLPWSLAFRMRVPLFAIRAALGGRRASRDLLLLAREAVHDVKPDVLAARVRRVLTVDARSWLKDCPAPILYLAGSEDVLVRRRSFRVIESIRPDVVRREIHAPHLVLQTAPDEAWRAIEEFAAERCGP